MKIHKTGGKVAKWDQDCQVVGQHCQVLFLAKTPVIAVYFVNIAKIAKSLRWKFKIHHSGHRVPPRDTEIFNPELNISWQDIGTGHENFEKHKKRRGLFATSPVRHTLF